MSKGDRQLTPLTTTDISKTGADISATSPTTTGDSSQRGNNQSASLTTTDTSDSGADISDTLPSTTDISGTGYDLSAPSQTTADVNSPKGDSPSASLTMTDISHTKIPVGSCGVLHDSSMEFYGISRIFRSLPNVNMVFSHQVFTPGRTNLFYIIL